MSASREKLEAGNGRAQDGSLSAAECRRVRSLSSTSERLPSLRQKRDLTLGGKPKRVFTPTIPARRVKKEVPEIKSPSALQQPSSSSPGAEKKQSKEKQERKKRERKRDVVASASVFSMGPAERTMERRAPPGLGNTSRTSQVTKPGRNDRHQEERVKVDITKKGHHSQEEEEEEEPMDTSSASNRRHSLFSSSSLPPVVLPLDYSLHQPCRTKALPSDAASVPPVRGVVKEESVEEEEEEVMETQPPCAPPPHSHPDTGHLSAAQIFSPLKSSKGLFLLLQLPDRLPLPPPPPPMEEDASGIKQDLREEHCQLKDIPEGLIGRLTVHQSGRVKLVLGSTSLDVTLGTRGGFLQQLTSIRSSDATPSLTVLGQLSHRVICTPDLESLLNDS